MKISILPITALLFLSISSSLIAQDSLYWRSDYKLKWEDFQGKPDTASQYAAITFSGIDFKYSFTDSIFIFKPAAFFDKKSSWKGCSVDNDLLNHEQLHFDITELFTRKLKYELSLIKANRSSFQKIIPDIIQKILIEKDQMQYEYDQETNLGVDSANQEKWQKKIALLLQKTTP